MTQTQIFPTESMINGSGVYILKIEDGALGNSKHQSKFYVGWSQNVQGRLHYHRNGQGAAWTRAANLKGLEYRVVAWIPGGTPGEKGTEGEIKAWKNTRVWVQAHPEYTVLPG